MQNVKRIMLVAAAAALSWSTMVFAQGAVAATTPTTTHPSAAAAGVKMVKIGSLDVRADSPLVLNEHPRLLFRKSDLPAIKARIDGPMKAEFDKYRAWWDKRIAESGYDWQSEEYQDGVALGVLYQLTGDRKYAEVVRKSKCLQNDGKFWSHSFAMDLIFDTLTPQEIKAQTDRFLSQKQQFTYCGEMALPRAVALYGGGAGADKELAEWIATSAGQAREVLRFANEWAKDRGGDVNSFSYIGNHTGINVPGIVTTLANALGEDAWQQCAWTRLIHTYYIYNYMPWLQAAIHFDNTNTLCPGPNWSDFGGTILLCAAPAIYRDGLYDWWIHHIFNYESQLAGDPARWNTIVMAGAWARFLWHDDAVTALPPENFPLSRFFAMRGMASMRDNWSKDGTFVHFRCGAWGGFGDNRHNADNNTFTIYHKGILALDTGPAHAIDNGRLKLDKPQTDTNCVLYSSESIAHNTILVYNPCDDAAWAKAGKANTGGQFFRSWPAEWDKMRNFKYAPQEIAHRGKVIAWETSPEYDYVCGDATGSYSPTTVNAFTRQLVYVRPNLVFVYDRIETARDGCKTTFLLHTADKPMIDGSQTPDTRIHPDGHFTLEGLTLNVTDQEMGGRMFCRMLLPETRQVSLLGGQGHEWELPDGRNIGPTAETYAMPLDSQPVREARRRGEGLRGWRVEIQDAKEGRQVRFLNVMQTAEKTTAAMSPCKLVKKDSMVGASVEDGGKTIEVYFNPTGAVGGKIIITQGGKTLVERPLTTKVEDNYERWSVMPDYAKWIGDPLRRNVVLNK